MANISLQSRDYGSFISFTKPGQELTNEDARLIGCSRRRMDARQDAENMKRVKKSLPSFFNLIPVLRHLPPHWRALAVGLVEARSFRKGDVICSNGEMSMIYIVNGEAIVTDPSLQQKRVRAGEVFEGKELSAVSDHAELVCNTVFCLASVLSRSSVDALAVSHPKEHKYILKSFDVIELWYGGDRHGPSVRLPGQVQALVRELREAAKHGEVSKLITMLDDRNRHLTDVADPTMLENSALHAASLCGRREAVRVLLECGASPNSRDRESYTPLHSSAVCGDAEVAQNLIAAGAEVNWSTDQFRTPLHVAAMHGNVEVIKVLLRYGAKIDVADAIGSTPFHLAVGYKRTEAVRELLLAGANIQKRNFHGRWGLHEAQFWRELELERTSEEKLAESLIKAMVLKVCRKEINLTEIDLPSRERNRDYLLHDYGWEPELPPSSRLPLSPRPVNLQPEREEEPEPVRDSGESRSSFHLV